MRHLFDHTLSSIHAAALILGAAGFLSKLLGFLRDRMLASHFGAGRELDIYYAAFQIPDFMSVIFLLGAGSAAILPVFQEYLLCDKKSAEKLISNLTAIFFLIASVLIFLAIVFADTLMRAVAPGFSGADYELLVRLSRVILLSPILLGLSSIFSTVVQSFHRFFAYAAAPILYNLGIILGIFLFVPFFGVLGLGAGVVLGACLHFLIQFSTVRSLGFTLRGNHLFGSTIGTILKDYGIRRVFLLSFPRVLALSFSQVNLFLMVALGSLLAQGSIAVFNLSYNLYFVPIGIFGISYSIALFPRLSQSYLMRDGVLFFQELFLGMRTILFWVLPSSAVFLILRAHIVRVVFGAGLFSWEDTRLTAAALAVLAFAMGAGSLQMLLIRAFYAIERTLKPLMVDCATLVVSFGSAYGMTRLIGQHGSFASGVLSLLRIGDIAHPEVLGLTFGFAAGIFFNTLLLYVFLIREARKVLAKKEPFPYGAIGKIIVASIIAGACTYGVRLLFADVIELRGFVSVLLHGAVAGFAGLFGYVAALYMMKSEDLRTCWESIRRKRKLHVLPESWDGEFPR